MCISFSLGRAFRASNSFYNRAAEKQETVTNTLIPLHPFSANHTLIHRLLINETDRDRNSLDVIFPLSALAEVNELYCITYPYVNNAYFPDRIDS